MSAVQYLNWLTREQANALVNLFVKMPSDKANGMTVKTADAIDHFGKFDADSPYAAIWASVHAVNPNTPNKTKLAKTDIDAYRYLPIDVDSKTAHQRKVSATDEERAKVLAKAEKIATILQSYGLPQPLKVMSGNGALDLFPIDLPYTADNYALMERLGKTLASMFNDADCDIDKAVIKDPCRILGVVGTINRSKAEVPSEGRYAKMRVVVGDYPPNVPMTADAFKTAAQRIIAEHGIADADADAEGKGVVFNDDEPLTAEPIPSGWAAVNEVSAAERFDRCRKYLEKLPNAVSGEHGSNKTLRAAVICFEFGLSDEQAKEMMQWFNANKCEPTWSDSEIEHKIQSAKDKAIFGERLGEGVVEQQTIAEKVDNAAEIINQDYPMTDLGNAEHFANAVGENIRFVVAWKAWVVFDGKRWKRDTNQAVGKMALAHVRKTMLNYAKMIADDERRQKYLKWASQCQAKAKIDAMVGLAQTILACEHSVFDAKPNLFNVANGTIELDTMVFRPHDRNDMLMKLSQVEYKPSATAPTWERFINRCFQDLGGKPRMEVIRYVQRAVGYTLTADDSAQCMFVQWGGGRNGKTTFMDATKGIMGEYAMNGLQSVLLKIGDGNGGRNTDDEAALFGARMVSVSETAEGQAIDESKLKRLVGSGQITAMRKFEHPFAFMPTHKLWMDCNHKPRVKGNDEGIWRRIKLIPWLIQIPPEERDEHLGEKLKAEYSGILNWALQGLSAWLADGRRLDEPMEIRNAVGEYRNDSDTFGAFISECLIVGDGQRETVNEVYRSYCRWAEENGMQFKLQKIEFGKRLAERGVKSKPSHGKRYFFGCSLKDPSATTDADADAEADTADAADERRF